MNINLVRKKIESNINKKVVVFVHGLRNKNLRYEGVIYKVYPNIFSIISDGIEKSFSYNDYISGEVKIKYL